MPWHERNGEGTEKEVLHYPGLPTKRTPIKGTVNYSGQLLIEYNSVACAQITVVCSVCIEELNNYQIAKKICC